jgi:hypothetical protein
MVRKLFAAVVVAALIGGTTPGAAGAQGSVAGTWLTEFPLRLRNINGVVSSDGTGHARISLTIKGDSVIGTWQVTDGDVAPPARMLRGTLSNGKARVESEPSEATLRGPDGEQKVLMKTVYEFTAKGDALDGTQTVEAVDGSHTGPARPFSAKRDKK